MSLSLVLRKNIRDATPKMTAALESMKESTGIDFTVEIDFAAVKALLPADHSSADRLGDVFYDYYLTALARNMKRFCDNGLQKEAVFEHLSEKKTIRFTLQQTKEHFYSKTQDDGGVLVCIIPVANFPVNVDELGKDLSKSLAGSGPLSLIQRKDIADNNDKLNAALEKIKTASGIDFDVEIDWADVSQKLGANSYKDRIGEAFYNYYMTALARNLERLCADELGKEAFAERVGSKRLIRYQIVEKAKDGVNGYIYTEIPSDGTLVLNIPKNNFCTNVDNAGSDIEKLL